MCLSWGHPQRSTSRKVTCCLCQTWAFLTLEQERLVSEAATGKCRPRDQREGHTNQSQRSDSCHLLTGSNGPQWAPARRKHRRGAQKAPPFMIKLEVCLHLTPDIPFPSSISFYNRISCSKESKSPDCFPRKKIPVP